MNANSAVYGNLALALESVPSVSQDPRFVLLKGGRVNFSVQSSTSRRRAPFFVFRLILGCVLVASILFFTYEVLQSRALAYENVVSSLEFSEVSVQPGESLWSLAEKYKVDGITTADMMQVLTEVNHLEASTLQPGQRLLVASDV